MASIGNGSSILGMKGMLAAALLLFPLVAAGEIYKWVDDKGVVHYGDQPPNPGARPLEDLPGLSTYSPPPVSKRETVNPSASSNGAKPLPEALTRQFSQAFSYRTLSIVSPEEEGTVRSSPGEVTIFVALDPPLRKGDYFKVLLDGQPWPGRFRTTVIRLQNVDRGAHKVAVAVYDAGGRRLLQTPPRTFYLHRTIARKRGG